MKFLMTIADGLNKLRDIPPLLFRLILAYGFLGPFMSKAQNIEGFAQLLEKLNLPVPLISAWVAMIVEGLGVLSFFFGFATRIMSFLLGFMLCVAIATVHWEHGFSAAQNGYEIPLYFLLMLLFLFLNGPGRVSIDGVIARPYRMKKPPHHHH